MSFHTQFFCAPIVHCNALIHSEYCVEVLDTVCDLEHTHNLYRHHHLCGISPFYRKMYIMLTWKQYLDGSNVQNDGIEVMLPA